MRIYDKPALSAHEAQRIARSGGWWAVAPLAGALSTRRLYDAFVEGPVNPEGLIAACSALADDLRRKIEAAEFIASRCLRWKTAPPDVEREKYWLPIVGHWIERAEAAAAYWHARGGPQHLDELRAAKETPTATPSPPTNTPIQIELKPVITVQLPEQPMSVVVQSMPARQTTSAVERNAAGEIVSTLQIEKDLVD